MKMLCDLQIHLLADSSVRVFSRNCEDRSRGFPDVADAIRAAAHGTLFVVTFICMCIAWCVQVRNLLLFC